MYVKKLLINSRSLKQVFHSYDNKKAALTEEVSSAVRLSYDIRPVAFRPLFTESLVLSENFYP